MSSLNVSTIILSTMEIESGRKLIGKTIDPNDTQGGLTDPTFDGHWTNWGWTESTLKAHGIEVHPRNLTFKLAYDSYEQIFFRRSGASAVMPYHPWLARLLFNYGVHAGYKSAAERLQAILNYQNGKGKRWPDLLVDGAVGPRTVECVKAYCKLRHGEQGRDVLFMDFIISMGSHYQMLAKANDKYEDYYYGWMNRLEIETEEYYAHKLKEV